MEKIYSKGWSRLASTNGVEVEHEVVNDEGSKDGD